jgi:short subunit dehydrogenase-like uncharacterized protein
VSEARAYDVVLLGATGFTGRLAAFELAARAAKEGARVALAGRSAAKLDALRDEIATWSGAPVDALEADVERPGSLAALAAATRVVATTVGPYARYGEPVVRACVEGGASYADISGEPGFVATTIARYDAAAAERGLRIVSCCGFDSLPPDLGVLFALQRLAPVTEAVSVEGLVRTGARFSGGTWHSAIGMLAELGTLRQQARALLELPRAPGRWVREQAPRVSWRRAQGVWAVPMPTIDPWIVLRSARLLPEYGPDFRYGHALGVPSLGLLAAGGLGVGALALLAQAKPTRELLLRLRAPGEGPSEAERAKGWFAVRILAESGERRVAVEVRGGDPGYTETSKMLAESALCLARDRLPERFGVLTPAAAMGESLVHRLQKAGIVFEEVEA